MTFASVLLVIYFIAQRQRVSNDLMRTRLSCRRMILLLPYHPPVIKLSLFQSSCVSPVEFTDERGDEGVWEEPNTGEKACFSISHSLLSAYRFVYSISL